MKISNKLYFSYNFLFFTFFIIFNIDSLAQVPNGNQLPDILKEIKYASGTCRREDKLKDMNPISNQAAINPDFSCARNPLEVQFLIDRNNAVVADLRPKMEYQNFHIKNSINLTQTDLLNKKYWLNKSIVLIGNGKSEADLFQLCSKMKTSGYQAVYILRGGVTQWLAYNQEIVGNSLNISDLLSLTSSEFWIESQLSSNIILLDKNFSKIQNNIPGAILLDNTSIEVIKKQLLVRQNKFKTQISTVILATDNLISEEKIKEIQKSILPNTLLIYTENPDNFLKYLTTQKALWAAYARGPKQPGCGL